MVVTVKLTASEFQALEALASRCRYRSRSDAIREGMYLLLMKKGDQRLMPHIIRERALHRPRKNLSLRKATVFAREKKRP